MTDKDLIIQDLKREIAQYEAKLNEIGNAPLMRWISVEDRLPPIDTKVVGWCKDNPFSHFTHEIVSWHGNGWVFPFAMRYVTSVTHWMPLPKPPIGV